MILMAMGKWFRSAQPKPKGQFWDSCLSIKMQIPSTAEFGIILIGDSFLQSLEMKPKQPETEPRGGEEPSLHNQAQLPESSFTMAFSVTEVINYIFSTASLGWFSVTFNINIYPLISNLWHYEPMSVYTMWKIPPPPLQHSTVLVFLNFCERISH